MMIYDIVVHAEDEETDVNLPSRLLSVVSTRDVTVGEEDHNTGWSAFKNAYPLCLIGRRCFHFCVHHAVIRRSL